MIFLYLIVVLEMISSEFYVKEEEKVKSAKG